MMSEIILTITLEQTAKLKITIQDKIIVTNNFENRNIMPLVELIHSLIVLYCSISAKNVMNLSIPFLCGKINNVRKILIKIDETMNVESNYVIELLQCNNQNFSTFSLYEGTRIIIQNTQLQYGQNDILQKALDFIQ